MHALRHADLFEIDLFEKDSTCHWCPLKLKSFYSKFQFEVIEPTQFCAYIKAGNDWQSACDKCLLRPEPCCSKYISKIARA